MYWPIDWRDIYEEPRYSLYHYNSTVKGLWREIIRHCCGVEKFNGLCYFFSMIIIHLVLVRIGDYYPSLYWLGSAYSVGLWVIGDLTAVLRIHDILGWIRIRICGSMLLTNGSGSGSCYFRHRPSRCQQKTNCLPKFFLLITFWSSSYIIFQR